MTSENEFMKLITWIWHSYSWYIWHDGEVIRDYRVAPLQITLSDLATC